MNNNLTYDFICLVSNDLSTENRMKRCCSVLTAHGKKVLLLGRKKPDSPQLDLEGFAQDRIHCWFNSGPIFYLELAIRFLFYLRKINFQNLICVDIDTAWIIHFFKKRNRKFYLDLHEYFEHVPELATSPIKRKIWGLLASSSIPKFDTCYTVNESLAKLFSDKYDVKVDYVMNIPSNIVSTEREFTIPLKMTYVGVLNPGRGLEELIEAIIRRKDVTLTIIGHGPLFQKIQELIGDSEHIEMLGHLSEIQISEQLQSTHLGWNLLDGNSLSYYYSLGNKFFQYIHASVPVITMKFPEYEKIIEEFNCGLLLENLEQGSIDEAIDKIVNYPMLWKSMQQACAKTTENFNWSRESLKLKNLYQL